MSNGAGPGITRRFMVAATTMGAGLAAPLAAKAETFQPSIPGGKPGWALAADGQKMCYEAFGKGDLRLVFVHGWTCDRSYWNQQVGAFSPDFRVVTLDLVGHGQSDKGRKSWSMEGLGDDVARVVKAEGSGPMVLVGHSMGGPVVIEAARRLGLDVVGVVTVDILTEIPDPHRPRPAAWTVEDYRAKAADMIRESMFTRSADPARVARIAAAMTAGSPETALALSEALTRYDARAGLTAIGKRPLTMIDAGDRFINATDLRTAHPRARIFRVEGVGHFIMLDDPATFNALLRSEVAQMSGRVQVV